MMNYQQSISNADLVLEVSPNYDRAKIDFDKYQPFLASLCGNRQYQKEAIIDTIRFFLGGEYEDLRELAEKNYASNDKLKEKYGGEKDFLVSLPFPDKLSCSLDHSTGSGKTYMMYGIAAIMLAEGAVDQVLILGPSNTIESGTIKTLKKLASDKTLKDVMPEDARYKNPRIINASQSIKAGDICVENIHAVYENTKSAISDSLQGKGSRTLVLNDEAHHAMNETGKNKKKWKEFLDSDDYGFRYIVSVSGTCYLGNDYFSDVIHRFSLSDAVEQKFVKLPYYAIDNPLKTVSEQFQAMHKNHEDNKKQYRLIKPLSLLVTKDISAAEKLERDLISFLAKEEGISKTEAAEKVLTVTSNKKHEKNLAKLENVDSSSSSVEWIVSVSMLTEGWDVKNVFQIIPHEERAFNSKLLIAQVMGRGLRIPEVYLGEQPQLTILNHASWSVNIKHLVEEVMEIEKRISSYPVKKDKDYNIVLDNISYEKKEKVSKKKKKTEGSVLSKGYIKLASQAETLSRTISYESLDNQSKEVSSSIKQDMFPVADVAQEIYSRLRAIDMEQGSKYAEKFSTEKLTEILQKSLRKVGEKKDQLDTQNRRRALAAFGSVLNDSGKVIRIEMSPGSLEEINTKDMRPHSISAASLSGDGTVFYDEDSFTLSKDEDKELLQGIDADLSLPKSAAIRSANKYDFKTPVNIVLSSHTPERDFIRKLLSSEVAEKIDAWIKSPDVGFYSLEYTWAIGTHSNQGSFNPDFFIQIGDDIIVVETKADDDVSAENRGKLRAAKEHFAELNKQQKKRRYQFLFLSPESYDKFFQALENNNLGSFVSDLQVKLEEANEK